MVNPFMRGKRKPSLIFKFGTSETMTMVILGSEKLGEKTFQDRR